MLDYITKLCQFEIIPRLSLAALFYQHPPIEQNNPCPRNSQKLCRAYQLAFGLSIEIKVLESVVLRYQ